MCSDKHRRLATLLLTCGLLVKGWGGTQDRNKKEKDRNKDSEKDMGKEPTEKSGSGTAVRLMGVTGKPQKVETGEPKGDKNRKDRKGQPVGTQKAVTALLPPRAMDDIGKSPIVDRHRTARKKVKEL